MRSTSASPRTIDGYLRDLRPRLRSVSDADDLVAEVEDHLRAAAAHLVEEGHFDPSAAESQAIADYGSPASVATGFRRGARQGGAIPTRFTRLSGLAAMATPLMLLFGSLFNQGPAKGPVHGLGVFLQTASYVTLMVAIIGLIRRHGGLGRMRWVIVGLLVAAPVLPFVLSWVGLVLGIVALATALVILSVGLYRAAILPRPAILLLFSAPAGFLLAALVITLAGRDTGQAGRYAAVIAAGIALAALAWFGWALWREPSLEPGEPASA